MTGIEIEFTVNNEEERSLNNEEGDETETGIPRPNPTTTHATEGRIRGSSLSSIYLQILANS